MNRLVRRESKLPTELNGSTVAEALYEDFKTQASNIDPSLAPMSPLSKQEW